MRIVVATFLCLECFGLSAGPTPANPVQLLTGIESENPLEEVSTESEADEGPQAIPAAKIARGAGHASRTLRAIRSRPFPDPVQAEIEGDFRETIEILESLKQQPGVKHPERLPLRRLEMIRDLVVRFRVQLEDWHSGLGRRVSEIEADKAELRELREVWEKTRDSTTTGEKVPAALIDRIGSVLGEVEELSGELREQLDAVLTVQDRVSIEESDINEILDRIDEAGIGARKRLLAHSRDRAWRTVLAGDERPLTEQVSLALRERASTFVEFISDFKGRALFQVLLFIVLVRCMGYLRRRSKQWTGDSALDEVTTHVLSRSMSSALLVALLAVWWIYPQGPLVVEEMTAAVTKDSPCNHPS